VVISHTLYQKLEVLGYISVARDIVLWYGAEQFRHLDLFRRDSQVWPNGSGVASYRALGQVPLNFQRFHF